jgi:N-acyl-D-aspartate/D-glutamate deacylase
VGLTVAQAAAQRGIEPVDLYFDLLLAEGHALASIHYALASDDFLTGLVHPHTSLGLDVVSSAAGIDDQAFNNFQAHPGHFGGMAIVLGDYVRERNLLRLEDAIRKMTSLPAQQIGLRDRGVLREGAAADVVVFDPKTIRCVGTWAKPKQYPVGIDYVLVNGTLGVERGRPTGALAGRVLQRC